MGRWSRIVNMATSDAPEESIRGVIARAGCAGREGEVHFVFTLQGDTRVFRCSEASRPEVVLSIAGDRVSFVWLPGLDDVVEFLNHDFVMRST